MADDSFKSINKDNKFDGEVSNKYNYLDKNINEINLPLLAKNDMNSQSLKDSLNPFFLLKRKIIIPIMKIII